MRTNWTMKAAVWSLMLTSVSVALAGAPRVQFDVARAVACRDVTTLQFANSHPGERLVEARIHVSSLIDSGREDDLLQYFYRFESPGRSVQIVDYAPKTTLASEVAGNVGVEKKQEKTKNLGLALTGSFEHLLKATGNGALGSKNATNLRYELIPPKELIASSGTVRRGSGVFFKLKPSPQSSLEGGKQFVIVFRAPANWRGDVLQVRCEAIGVSRGIAPAFDEKRLRGRDFVVGLYAEGDEEAKALATAMSDTERALRRIATRERKRILRRAYPTTAHRVGAMLSLTNAKIPADWMTRVIAFPLETPAAALIRLPQEVRRAAKEYISAAERLQELSGTKMP